MKHEKGRQLLYQLIDKADVFYTNYQGRVLRELEADYEALSHHKPSLIYGRIGSYGTKGSWGSRRGYGFSG